MARKEKLPYFKYHPEPLKTRIFQRKKAKCACCHQQREIIYVGPFYSNEVVPNICPWCIKDGSAANKYNGTFHDSHSLDQNITNEKNIDELIYRTPGYIGWQQEFWLSH
jgi:uncharacterized protein CbrC (UPF0167 family)